MTSEEADRMMLGWSREHLARVSGVNTASIYLLERMGSAGPEDDRQIQNALAHGKAQWQAYLEHRDGGPPPPPLSV